MREIKFRAVIPERNATACFGINDLFNPIFSIREIVIPWLKAGNVPDRFTGLHDKNGKEIYEGDILSDGLYRGAVEFGDFYRMADCGGDSFSAIGWHMDGIYDEDDQVSLSEFDDSMVIGNIYENPELLNAPL